MLASGNPSVAAIYAKHVGSMPIGDRLPLRAALSTSTGYGQLVLAWAMGLESIGVRVALEPTTGDPASLPEPVRRLIVPKDAGRSRPTLDINPPDVIARGRDTVVATMWETDRLDASWVAALNGSRGIVVPCGWNAQVFRSCGVARPIAVVPLGVDTGVYHAEPGRLPSSVFHIGMAFYEPQSFHRKGWRDGVRAWLDAVGDAPEVRLSLKIWPEMAPWVKAELPADDRIAVVAEMLPESSMADWYRSLDAYLCPSRGEGWGLCNLQAMSCGVPLIASTATAMGDYHDEETGWVVPHRWQDARGGIFDGRGKWAVPDVAAMTGAIRAALEDWRRGGTMLAAKGTAASARAATFTWDRSTRMLATALRSFGVLPPEPVPPSDPPPSPDGRLAHCGEGVWVGSALACDAAKGHFPLTIHVAKDADPEAARCRCYDHADAGLSVRYTEGAPLSTADPPIAAIAAYARKPGAILCHCVGGVCRGPTMAVLALVARGVEPEKARSMVRSATARYGVEAMLSDGAMGEIDAFAGRQAEIRGTLNVRSRMKSCPHFSPTGAACGCGTCSLGRGRSGEVSPADCSACPDLPAGPDR